ncbi:MAG: OsmC family protein [Phaeodactylibacter sp.]|nr:OsmC family protein [Phaeodactylibacter sp.]
MTHQVSTEWVGKRAFDHQIQDHIVRTDALEIQGGDNSGPSPKRLLLAGLTGCTAVDIVSILDKMRVPIDSLRITAEADLGEEHPKVYTHIRMQYIVSGKNIDRTKVERAVKLSQEQYCGVAAMLRKNCPIDYTIEYLD